VKTIVTTDLAEKIAAHYGVETINVLTGFKYIGEVIGRLEKEGRESDYVCGFEESFGYLTGTYVRDKDGVNAAFLICEMFAFYRTRGISLTERLNELYGTYGYCRNTLHSYEFKGSAGMRKMEEIMEGFHRGLEQIGGQKTVRTEDYSRGLYGLPASDVMKFFTECGSVVIRPSGTEPKLKAYISVTAEDRASAEAVEEAIAEDLETRLR
jgi:phosphoglucomutase